MGREHMTVGLVFVVVLKAQSTGVSAHLHLVTASQFNAATPSHHFLSDPSHQSQQITFGVSLGAVGLGRATMRGQAGQGLSFIVKHPTTNVD
jgi:hypothetical protein